VPYASKARASTVSDSLHTPSSERRKGHDVVLPKVILISNDIVPGMAMPVAAPGLRVFGLGVGLRHHGFPVVTVVAHGPVHSQWTGTVPPPTPPGAVVLKESEMADFISAEAPAVVVLTNSNQFDNVRPESGVRYVIDLFAPKMLELAFQDDAEGREAALNRLRQRKLRAIEAADAFIVNGRKKIPYFIAWLLLAGRDIRTTPLEPVFMCLPSHFREREKGRTDVRIAVAGYLQGWSLPGAWLDHVAGRLDPPRVTLQVVLPVHWGQRTEDLGRERMRAIYGRPGVTNQGAMRFDVFQEFMSTIDVAIDLFDHTIEREYAVVTRSVVAAACGVPVVHPPFTEVSPLIAQYDAGWLVDPDDVTALDTVLDEIVGRPDVVAAKTANARRLWREVIDPAVAVEPLARIVKRLASE
jgi:hypothetical protein